MSKITQLILCLFILLPPQAWAFVENVTHGYVNCMSCHVSPSGGGLLNDYGRALSNELMSTWSWKGSEDPLFGAVHNTDNLKWGGDQRLIQTEYQNHELRRGRLFFMQNNIEAGYTLGKVTVVGTVGLQGGPQGTPQRGEFLSERHYLLWQTAEQNFLRVGKFRVNYGLYDPDHTRVVKAPLGFGPNSETYNMEYSHFTENWEVFVTAGLGRLDVDQDPNSERNLSGTFAYYLRGKAKIGTSVLTGESSQLRRNLLGVFGILPVTERTLIKFEADFQRSSVPASSATRLLAAYASYEWQAFKGFTVYGRLEGLQPNLDQRSSLQTTPGVGVQWLPIPHLEIQAEVLRRTLQSNTADPENTAWLLFHVYL